MYRQQVLDLLFSERNPRLFRMRVNGHCELNGWPGGWESSHVGVPYLYPNCPWMRRILLHYDPNRCILCTRCVRVCDEIEGAHTWDVMGRGTDCLIISDLNQPWERPIRVRVAASVCAGMPTGALFYKTKAVAEMEKRRDFLPYLRTMREDENGTKQTLATVWLDGCSGCHMSSRHRRLLGSWLFRSGMQPSRGYKDFRRWSSGGCQQQGRLSQDQKVRAHTRLFGIAGRCAVTANVPAKNRFSVRSVWSLSGKRRSESTDTGGSDTVAASGLSRCIRWCRSIYSFPGCPPSNDTIYYGLTELLAGRRPVRHHDPLRRLRV